MNAEGVIASRSNQTFTDEELFYSYRKVTNPNPNPNPNLTLTFTNDELFYLHRK